ncbi:hypothetical protein CAPTEDRAFT_18761 [Capitella teleta]|uniref:Intraflagellar transport protein 43 homolog n=1 Tax=Capitella teleta TaxID=283909 RepID=R7U7U5_CAPTE|nr:hypothetical protein CAPTEDRAFT_18761 [Capitella teleta]|eukprot:ELT99200.1 hypothetical protein CAPTEDRAFT_18761 [Capitella teleta]
MLPSLPKGIQQIDSIKWKSAKTGRRAKKLEAQADINLNADEDEVLAAAPATSKATEGPDLDGPPKPSRRMSGWASETAPLSSRRRTGDEDFEELMPFEEGYFESRTLPSERLRPHSPEKAESDGGQDIPTIPDLEDQGEDDLTAQVAMAPNVVVNRVATYRELDNDLLRHAAFLTLDNEIDLKILSKGLSAEADVQDPDVVWEWDRLFTEVTSELLTDWEQQETTEDDATTSPVA